MFVDAQLRRPYDAKSDHPQWIACQSLLLASLSQFVLQYDCLYGEQFHNADGFPKELLAEEFVAEKVVEFWGCVDAVWREASRASDPTSTSIVKCVEQACDVVLLDCGRSLWPC